MSFRKVKMRQKSLLGLVELLFEEKHTPNDRPIQHLLLPNESTNQSLLFLKDWHDKAFFRQGLCEKVGQ